MQKLLLDGVFGPRQLDSLRLTEYQVEKELKTALSCPSCSGMVAPSRRSAQCRSCLGNGVATVVCPECSGSPASPGCGRCSGAGRIPEENPRLFMDRLQWYWFAYNRRRFVDLAIRIVFGRKIHLAICTGAGLVYAGLAFLSGAPGGALDLLAESLFLGAATVAGLVAVGVILILLLCLRGTATFDIPWPTPDPTLGLKLWRRCANLVITDATFLFVAYGFGFPFLLFEPEVVTTSASVTVLLSVVGGLTLFAVFAVLGLMIIHHAMQVARDSKLLELEDNMLERDETFRA